MFGPHGSGSVIYSSDPDPSINKQQKFRKTYGRLLYDFLSLKDDVNVLSKMNKHKNLEEQKNFVGVWILEGN